ncbi:MAG: hypothetical protein ACOX1P_06990 [Thermoguttaceae bacterium]
MRGCPNWVTAREQPPVSWRELLAIAAMVALADVAIYRGHGFAGYAALFLGAPILLLFGAPQPRFSAGLWAVGVMLAASAVRLAWCGWGLPVACGMVLLVAFAMVLAGIRPYLVELVVFASQSILSGYEGLAHYLAHQYNVRRIMAGDSAPSVQISVHPIDSEGVLSLLPLVDCPDPIVRAGVVAMLADRHEEAERLAENRKSQGWTAYQLSDQLLLEQLRLHQSKWVPYLDRAERREARTKFYSYAFQWY